MRQGYVGKVENVYYNTIRRLDGTGGMRQSFAPPCQSDDLSQQLAHHSNSGLKILY